MLAQRRQRRRVRIDQPVHRRPQLAPAPGPRAQRPRQMHIGAEQIVRRANRRLGIGVHQFVQHRQIEFRVIDRVGRIRRRRP